MLVANLGGAYALFGLMEGGVLRLTRDKNVWFGILGAMLVCDIGHLYAVISIAPERILQVGSWTFDEWINYGMLVGGTVLRALFLLGVGRD